MKNFKFAYAIWPWGLDRRDQTRQAIKEITEIGFNAFESVKETITLFMEHFDEFFSIINQYNAKPVSFYFHQTGDLKEDVKSLKDRIKFMEKLNISRMSLQAPARKGNVDENALKHVLKITEEMAHIANDYGIIPCIHPHEGTMIMYENEIDFIMKNTDPEHVAFGPDTAHLVLGKTEPEVIFKRYADRIKFVHLKDVMKTTEVKVIEGAGKGFDVYSDFLELGEGNVNFNSIFKILENSGYDGYLTVEIDRPRISNKESALKNMEYLKKNNLL